MGLFCLLVALLLYCQLLAATDLSSSCVEVIDLVAHFVATLRQLLALILLIFAAVALM